MLTSSGRGSRRSKSHRATGVVADRAAYPETFMLIIFGLFPVCLRGAFFPYRQPSTAMPPKIMRFTPGVKMP